MGKRRRATATADALQVVQRRCTVCDWEGQLVERRSDDPLCPWCYAPTERTTVIGLVVPGQMAADDAKNPFASNLGRLGGQKGGRARAAKLSARERRDIARKAAQARWGKKRR